MAIPLHLAVHLAGIAVAAGLALLVLLPPFGGRRGAPGGLPVAARWSIAVGAGLLAASHLVVGSLLADPEAWPLLLRASGYAAFAVGAAGGLARRRSAPAADRHPLVAVVVLALVAAPPALALATGAAGAAACIATAWGALGRGRQVAPLVVGIGLYAVGDLVVGARPAVAAVLSLAGSAAAGAWVVGRAARRSLAGRFASVSLVTLLALVVGLGAASGLVLASDVQAEQRERLDAIAASQATDLVDRTGAALDATAAAVADERFTGPLAADDADLAADRMAPVLSLPEVEVAVLVDATGALVDARGRDGEDSATLPLAASNVVAGARVTAAALAGDLARGVIDPGDGSLLVVGAAPVAPRDDQGRPQLGRQAGALVLGRDLTRLPVVERVAAETATDATIIIGDRVAATTLDEDDAALLVADPDRGTVTLREVERVVASADLGERGRLVLALPADTAMDAARTATRSAFLVAVIGLALGGAVATVLARRTAAPVGRLTSAAERVAAGDLATRVRLEREDEVGRLAAAFDGMTVSLAGRDRDLRTSLVAQQALRDRLEAVTASMGEALLATLPDGTVTTANPAARGILGVDDGGDLVGRPLRDVLRGQAEGGGDLHETLGGVGVRAVRGALAGSGRVVEATAAPLAAGETTSAGRVYVIRDITERVLADRVRTEIIANLSHELKTPLTPVKAFLELVAARDGVDQRYRPMLDLAREGGVRLERTITALVDLAELEAGRTPVTLEPLAVGSLVGDLLARWRERAGDRTLTRRVQRGTPRVLGDALLVGRVLDVLVDNALKFSVGPVRITAQPDGQEVRMQVRDHGPGIAPSQRAEVFELFVQADGSSTRPAGGLGLGLPTAARVTALLGGRLELDDAPGGGTVATLVLPVAATAAAP